MATRSVDSQTRPAIRSFCVSSWVYRRAAGASPADPAQIFVRLQYLSQVQTLLFGPHSSSLVQDAIWATWRCTGRDGSGLFR